MAVANQASRNFHWSATLSVLWWWWWWDDQEPFGELKGGMLLIFFTITNVVVNMFIYQNKHPSWSLQSQGDDAHEPDGGGGGGARQEEACHCHCHKVGGSTVNANAWVCVSECLSPKYITFLHMSHKKLFPSVYPFVTLYYSGEIFVKIYVENCVPSSAFSITDTNLLLCTINNPKCWIKIKSAVCPPETYPPKVHPPISNNIQSQLRWGPKAQIKTLRTPQNVPARPGWWLLWGIWGFWWRWRFFTASSQLREFSFLSAVCRRHPLHKDLIDIENIFF